MTPEKKTEVLNKYRRFMIDVGKVNEKMNRIGAYLTNSAPPHIPESIDDLIANQVFAMIRMKKEIDKMLSMINTNEVHYDN